MSPARPRASLIYNPRAGRRHHSRTIQAIQAALGASYELTTTPTAGPEDAIALARESARRGDAAAFAWGGDGTVREVLEGVLGSPVAIGVLPGGTFNVVALAIGLPRRNAVKAAVMLANAKAQPRDVGMIGETPFFMQATAGFDGFVMHEVRADLKARIGMAGPLIDALRALSKYGFPLFDVEVDGVTHRVTGAAFVNMTEYAGRYRFVPGARWDDGRAHALLYRGRTRLSAVSFAVSIGLGHHHMRSDVKIIEASRLVIGSNDAVFLQADGDPWRGARPVTCRLASERVNVLIP